MTEPERCLDEPERQWQEDEAIETGDSIMKGPVVRNLLTVFLVFLFLSVVAFFRFWGIGEKPLHHDESLFAYYAYQVSQSSRGNYHAGTYAERYGDYLSKLDQPATHHPLLHGPFLIQVTGTALSARQSLGLDDDLDDAVIRCFPALCLLAILLMVFGFGPEFPRAGRWFAVLLLSVSPVLWYYSRFCRNDLPFAGASVAAVLCWSRALAGKRYETFDSHLVKALARDIWLVGALLATALMVAIKENSVFMIFNGLTFSVLWLVLNLEKAGEKMRALFGRGRVFSWLIGIVLAWFFLEVVYTNFFLWDTSFLQMFSDAFHYWAGQHSEHRLYGEFHYYLPRLLLYQPFAMLAIPVVGAIVVVKHWRFKIYLSLALGFTFFFLALAVGMHLLGRNPETGEQLALNTILHMTSPFHLALAVVVGWFTLCAAVFLLRHGHGLGAWLAWWTGLSFLQYSYAGEKVPWITVHMALPLLLTTGYLAGLAWGRAHDREHLPHLRRRDLLTGVCILAVSVNFAQGFRLCFYNASNPAELMVYNHTQPQFKQAALRMRGYAKIHPEGNAAVLVQGEPTWPLLWYLRGTNYLFANMDTEPQVDEPMRYVACDNDYIERYPVLRERFHFEQVSFRRHWFPDSLYLFRPLRFALRERYGDIPGEDLWSEADYAYLETHRWQYGPGAWRSLAQYIVFREIWGQVEFAARPMTVPVGRRRVVSE